MREHRWSSWLSWLTVLLLTSAALGACAATTTNESVATLQAKYASLAERLRLNQFKRPLVLDSDETQDRLRGDIYAIVDYPFAAVAGGLSDPDHWCDVMLLHINTKYCQSVVGPSGTSLRVMVGRKTQEELAGTTLVELNFNAAASTPDHLDVVLSARDGPMGTSDYRILLEAIALPNAKTFLHLTYSYAMSVPGWLAVQTYLGTIGRDKVGFTVTATRADGQADYIGGVRGLLERNTMRYYLAIESYLAAGGVAPAARFERRLQTWFTAVEQYPRQLHEMDRSEYLEMKRAEYVRQQTAH